MAAGRPTQPGLPPPAGGISIEPERSTTTMIRRGLRVAVAPEDTFKSVKWPKIPMK